MSQSQPGRLPAARSTSSVKDRNTQTEIGRPHQRDLARSVEQRGTLRIVQPGGAGHQWFAALRTQGQDRCEALRQAEVDRHIEGRRAAEFAGGEIRHTIHHALRRRTPHHRTDDVQALVFGGQSQQCLAHPPGGAVDQNFHRRRCHGGRLARRCGLYKIAGIGESGLGSRKTQKRRAVRALSRSVRFAAACWPRLCALP